MSIDNYLKNLVKKPIQKGDTVFVYNGNDELIRTYRTIDLGKQFFSMSNDSFYAAYGFNFVPEGLYWELSKKVAGKM